MSASDVLLNIGMEGSFELAPPFTNKIRPNARYTIRSLRTMGDFVAVGEDPQELYTENNIDETTYLRDLQNDVCIVGLQSSTGESVNVPQSYILSLPLIDGVSYRPLALVAPLGLVIDDLDLSNLISGMNALVMKHLGVQSECSIASVGAAELVTHAEHDRITAERIARASYSESEAAKMVRLERANAELLAQNAALAEHIRQLS